MLAKEVLLPGFIIFIKKYQLPILNMYKKIEKY